MSGSPLPIVIPPGINSDVSRYMAKQQWWDGNLVRWNDNGVLKPVGGWQILQELSGPANPVRELFSWSDNTGVPFLAFGTLDKIIIKNKKTSTEYDATPAGLIATPSGATGFGSGSFGVGRFGLDSSNNSGGGSDNKFDVGYWTLDSWGQNLIGVHSVDGHLWQWDPTTPTTDMVVVTNAPLANRLCITTDERHVMVMGGPGNPRRVKWCSREDITTWAAGPTNSAGGWDLDTTGQILGAIKVPQGILVATDIDMHLIEYIGPPDYYGRRLITSETGIIAPKAMAPIPNGAVIVGSNAFWEFAGGVSKIPCTVSVDVFKKGEFNYPLSCFMGINEPNQEAWFFYPAAGELEASRFVIYKYGRDQRWWSKGILSRTAWHNPSWGDRPIAANNLTIYEHERDWTNNGSSRSVYAETGAFEIANGERNMAVKKVFHDTVFPPDFVSGSPIPYNMSFKMARAPQGPETTYGPVTLNASAGYTTLRFKSRQVAMRIAEVTPSDWGLGITRLVATPVGGGR